MNLKKILTWAGVAIVIYFLVSAPEQAGGVVNGIFASLQHAADAVITFMQNIFK